MKLYSIIGRLAVALPAIFYSCEPLDDPQEAGDAEVKVTGVAVSPSTLILEIGGSGILSAVVAPENATHKEVSWSSSAVSVVTVDNGKVTAVSEGTAVVYATAGEVKGQCEVTVLAPPIDAGLQSIPDDNPLINGGGGSMEISFSPSGNWTAGSDVPWLTVSPSSGDAGQSVITISTVQNDTRSTRTGILTISQPSGKAYLKVMQRAWPYARYTAASGTITNRLVVNYKGTEWERIYALMPVPTSNMYQDITDFSAGDATVYDCPDNVNHFAVSDIYDDFPNSGEPVLKETFYVTAYEISVNLNLITDIAEYNPDSEQCLKYLGAEEGDLVNPGNSEIATVATELWTGSGGNLIDYARACYEWTAENMTYGNMNTGLHTITELMKTKKGDCGNFCSVFISLLRAKGIPARHIVMISPMEAGYHVRAEFYIPGYGWIPADPTFKNGNPGGNYFGHFNGKYVVMSFGVNSSCTNPNGSSFRVPLLQTYCYWYWHANAGSSISFVHLFSNFK